MKIIKYLSLIILLLISIDGLPQSLIIKNYRVYLGIAKKDNKEMIMLRRFNINNKDIILLLDPYNLDTKFSLAKDCNSIKLGFNEIENKFKQSPYFRLINESKKDAKSIQDAGITHCLPKETGVNLTIDLCPSKHHLNRKIFTAVLNTFQHIERPVPLAIAISGRWIKEHQKELLWLKELQKNGDINITWINHSLTHHYNKKLPLEKNFMLMNTTNVENEVLGNEQLMIQNGLEPSVFFRFPGLISNNELLSKIYDLGLICIGSDAWLAKGNAVHEGSIVLIHGNGNEGIGVSKFIELLLSKKTEEQNKSWLLLDLRKSLEDEYLSPEENVK